jgi:hypothetical protein
MAIGAQQPWHGKPWAVAAEAANNGLNGQGYIVHTMMRANRAATYLTVAILVFTIIQVAAAILQGVVAWGVLTAPLPKFPPPAVVDGI